MKIHEVDCVFIPMELYLLNDLLPLQRHMKKNRNVLYWYVNRKYISYNQIKKEIILFQHNNKTKSTFNIT